MQTDENDKLVSIIIRTCGRPDILYKALQSVKKQTYKNIETVIVEDGNEVSKSMIDRKFPSMRIKYYALGEKKGRSFAGNFGLSMATGDYFNFLDDDDILYPNHIETLVKEIKTKAVGAVYSIAEESQIQVISEKPYRFKEKRVIIRYRQPYNKLLLFAFNYIPIQSILFARSLYDELGGFDEKLDFLEDWDLWVRYSIKNDFLFLPVVTSKYYVPFRNKKKVKRNVELESALRPVKEKFLQYEILMNVSCINKELDYILYVHNKKKWYYYLKKIRDFLLYKEM